MILGWKLPLPRLSATSLSLAVQCPEAFRQRYIVRERDSDVMFGARFVGIVDHRVNEDYLRRKMAFRKAAGASEPEPVWDSLLQEIYAVQWNRTVEEHGEPDWRDDDPVKMLDTGVKMAQTYHQQVDVNPVALEERFEVRVPGVPVPISGYIDVIERDKIRERKTTGVKTTKPKPKWRFQGMIYNFATGLPVVWDVVTRQVTPQVFTYDAWDDLRLPPMPLKVTEQLVRDAAKRVNDLYCQYGHNNTWPMDGIITSDWACNYCVIGPKYERTCPAWASI